MIIRGKKVILRPAVLSDAPRFVKWFNNPEVNKNMLIRSLTLTEEKQWIKNKAKDINNHHFCICTSDDEHIGAVSLELGYPRNKSATYGIMIGEQKLWGNGFGRDATQLVLEYGFRKLKLNRIELDVYSYNTRAIKFYKKFGFKKEGVKREANFYNGKFYDTILMSILKSEFLG